MVLDLDLQQKLVKFKKIDLENEDQRHLRFGRKLDDLKTPDNVQTYVKSCLQVQPFCSNSKMSKILKKRNFRSLTLTLKGKIIDIEGQDH